MQRKKSSAAKKKPYHIHPGVRAETMKRHAREAKRERRMNFKKKKIVRKKLAKLVAKTVLTAGIGAGLIAGGFRVADRYQVVPKAVERTVFGEKQAENALEKRWSSISRRTWNSLPNKIKVKAVEDMVSFYAQKYSVPEKRVKAVIWWESGFYSSKKMNFEIVGPTRDIGIAQFNPNTVKFLQNLYRQKKYSYIDFEFTDPKNPQQAVRACCIYLKYLAGETGNYETATVAYNKGPGRVKKGEIDIKNKYLKNVKRVEESL